MQMDRIQFGEPTTHVKAWDLPNWRNSNQTQRMRFLREVAVTSGLDPRMATFVVSILRSNNVKPRDYVSQASVLLSWVQDNIYYINEPRERLQEPFYTLKVGYGDCDDMVLLLAAMFTSINLEFRFVLSGNIKGKLMRWIEGQPHKSNAFNHIYLMVGNKPFKPTKWLFCEPTIKVPLGWDIVGAKGKLPPNAIMPEFGEVLSLDESGEYSLEQQDEGFLRKLSNDLKDQLHPHRLATIVISGAVISVLTGMLSSHIRNKILK